MTKKTTAALLSILISGFAAQAAKPDFAFPKQVSQQAEKELKKALNKKDGPATLRALMNLTLAEGLMEPDSLARIEHIIESTTSSAQDPATKAMGLLLRAEVASNAVWANSALHYTKQLRATPIRPWLGVVNADPTYTPTLYDFAVARCFEHGISDSLQNQILEFHADNPAPYIYWTLAYNGSEAKAWSLYDRYRQLSVSYYPLVWLNGYGSSDPKKLYNAALSWIEEHPDAPINAKKEIKCLIDVLTRQQININGQEVVKPGKPFEISVHSANVNKATLAIYEIKPEKKLIKKIPLEFAGSGIFHNDTTVTITLPKFGEYRIFPLLDGDTESADRNGYDLAVSDFVIQVEHFASTSDKLAIDPLTGEEQHGVKFYYDSKRNNRLFASRGEDKYTPSVWARRNSPIEPENWVTATNILTDRSIYHPGDTVKYAVTAYQFKGGKRKISATSKIIVIFRDANRQQIAISEGVTDGLGRFTGEFAIPENGLTGYFSICTDNEPYGGARLMVSDYKAPEFEVDLNAVRIDSTHIELTGTATNYSGFPVQGADVAIRINKLLPWVWLRNFTNGVGELIKEVTVSTDASGKFSSLIEVPSSTSLSANAKVTSMLGESHEADCFIPWKKYFISADIPANLCIPEPLGSWRPNVTVTDSEGKQCDIPLVISLTSKSDTISQVQDWNNVPSGKYTLQIYPELSELADTFSLSDIAIYRKTDKEPPYQTVLWVPETEVNSGEDVMYGTSYNDSNIRYVLWTPDSILDKKWITPAAGNASLRVTLPDNVNEATLTLWSMRDYKMESHSVSVKRRDTARNLKLKISSMRDKMNAGDKELWTISVTDNLNNPIDSSAVILDVYSKALDALSPLSFYFHPRNGRQYSYFVSPGSVTREYASSETNPTWPRLPEAASSFQTYGIGWPSENVYHMNASGLQIRGTMLSSKRALFASTTETEMVKEESSDSSVEFDATDADGGQGTTDGNQNYRLPETPSAMWCPVITTNEKGESQIQFTAPDATTTWAVKALAYNKALLTGNFSAEIITSKPVMVQSSFPRFLREGDVIELKAMAVNNTDTEQMISAFVEIFDPLTNAIIDTKQFEASETASMTNRLITLPLHVTSGRNLIGIRVRATAGNFTDGEQTVVPVLPSAVTVMESKPIVMAADSTSLKLDVAPGSVVTFTANAAWECVTALPGLIDTESKNAFAAVSTLYSASVAEGLLRSYPEIGKALRTWQQSDSVLMSRLEKNEDLKLALLENTPWIAAAESDSERMARLSLLLNKNQNKKIINKAITSLAKQVRKGGLAWFDGDDTPSTWATTQVLLTLGRLKNMGYLPSDQRLSKIIKEGVQYLDKEVARSFAKDPDGDYSSYVEMRSYFPEQQRTLTVRKITNATVQRLVADWRDLSLISKSRAAIILNQNNYHATAKHIIQSLREYNAWRQTGVTSAILNAFVAVEPESKEIDEIRMWLLSRKQTMDWGKGLAATEVISSLLRSGSNWLVPAANALSVTINRKETNPHSDAYTGSFRLNMPEGGELSIEKGAYPAWGGVWSQYSAEADSVNESTGKELRITRHITGDMTVGSRITVTLTIESDRALDYVVVESPFIAAIQPVNQLPYRIFSAYVEPTPTKSNIFIRRLPKGKMEITQDFYVTAEGQFLMAPAQVQSQYEPSFTANSSGSEINTIAKDQNN